MNRLLKQFAQMRKMLKAMGGMAAGGGGEPESQGAAGIVDGKNELRSSEC